MKKKKEEQVKTASEDYAFREFIKMQKEYKELFLARLYKGAEIKEVRKQLDSGIISMQWYGMSFPEEILVIEHDILQNNYYDLLTRENQLRDALVSKGLCKEDFECLISENKLKKTFEKDEGESYIG